MTTQAAMNKQAHASLRPQTAARSPWIEGLPQELFVNIVTYLEPHEIVRATHVCLTWRESCLTQPKLWTTLHLSCNLSPSRYPIAKRQCFAKWDEYRRRMGESPLLELRLYAEGCHPIANLGRYSIAVEHFDKMLSYMTLEETQNLRRLFLWHKYTSKSSDPLTSSWLVLPILPMLQQIRVDIPDHDPVSFLNVRYRSNGDEEPIRLPTSFMPETPALQTLEFSNLRNTGSLASSRFSTEWPHCAQSKLHSPQDGSLPSLTVATGSVDSDLADTGRKLHRELDLLSMQLGHRAGPFTTLEMLPDIANLTISVHNANNLIHATDWSTLTQLRTLHLNGNVDLLPTDAANDESTPFPPLEKLTMSNITSATTILLLRILRSQSRTPSLRFLRLDALPPRLSQGWPAMRATTASLQDVRISASDLKTWPSDRFVQWMSNVTTLHLRQCDISQSFLESARKHLTQLTSLDVSYCTNITSSPLLQLIQARQGKITFLGIEGCYDLQKEAVDWCKANVATVKWSGWRDKNEGKKYGFLA